MPRKAVDSLATILKSLWVDMLRVAPGLDLDASNLSKRLGGQTGLALVFRVTLDGVEYVAGADGERNLMISITDAGEIESAPNVQASWFDRMETYPVIAQLWTLIWLLSLPAKKNMGGSNAFSVLACVRGYIAYNAVTQLGNRLKVTGIRIKADRSNWVDLDFNQLVAHSKLACDFLDLFMDAVSKSELVGKPMGKSTRQARVKIADVTTSSSIADLI